MKCIYCLEEKDDKEFSLEHIVPQSLGGTLLNDTFRTRRVCKKCNNLCGLFVDDACLRSFFNINAKMAATGQDFYPSYIGMVEVLNTDAEVCDMWVFPKGSIVYHFRPNEEKYKTHVGGNPITRHKGGAIAILVLSELVCKEQSEIEKTIQSFMQFFAKNDLYAFNFEIANHDEVFKRFDETTNQYKEKIESIKDTEHKCNVIIALDAPLRFYCKIALALGHNILGDPFLETDYAKELIKGLGLSKIISGNSLAQGSDFLTHKNDVAEWFKFGKANTMTIFLSGLSGADSLACTMSIYGNVATFLISPDIKKLNFKPKPFEQSNFYIWLPSEKLAAKPITLLELIAYKQGCYKNEELDKLKELS